MSDSTLLPSETQWTEQQMSNETNAESHDSNMMPLNWFALLLLPIPVWIFFGNLSVLIVIFENPSLRKTWSNKIIFSLALTDMSIAVIVMPFAAISQVCCSYLINSFPKLFSVIIWFFFYNLDFQQLLGLWIFTLFFLYNHRRLLLFQFDYASIANRSQSIRSYCLANQISTCQ